MTEYYNESMTRPACVYNEYYNESSSQLCDLLMKRPLGELLAEDAIENRAVDEKVAWYHGLINREKAENIIRTGFTKYGQVDGLFVVRESATVPNDFALSLSSGGKLLHFQIQRQYAGHYHIDNGPVIQGLDKIIERHGLESHGLPVKLHQFCPGKPPPNHARKTGFTNLLHTAVRQNNSLVVRDILKSRQAPDINAKNEYGTTALHDSCFHGYTDIVTLLLDANADASIHDIHCHTPLHKACVTDQPHIATLLLKKGNSEPQEQNPVTGWVPLHEAAMRGHIECIRTLLAFNAPLYPRTHSGETPLDIANTYDRPVCADVLSKFKPPIAKTNKNDWYHENTDRQGAVEMFEKHNVTDGLFLVRPSSRRMGWHVLSLCFNRSAYNFEIKTCAYTDKQVYCIDEGPYLMNLEHLIDHYVVRPDGLPCTLQRSISCDGRLKTMSSLVDYPEAFSSYRKIALPVLPLKPVDVKPKPTVKPRSGSLNKNVIRVMKGSSLDPLARPPPPSEPPPVRRKDPEREAERQTISKEHIILGNILGEGEYGSVYKGTFFKDGKKNKKMVVAIKTFHEDQVNAREDFFREASVMQALDHPCIVKLIGVCDGPPLMMVEEFIAKGSMLDFLWDHESKVDVKTDLYLWAAQIAAGMTFLESQLIVHRDLAARNILLQSKKQVKISDFGLSRAVGAENNYYRASKGGRWPIKWYAPECVNYGQFSHASDVWSFGVTLWEMFSFGEPPYGDMTGAEVLKYLESSKRLARPEKCPEVVYQVMMRCWSLDKHERPTFRELSAHFNEDSEYASIRDLVPRK